MAEVEVRWRWRSDWSWFKLITMITSTWSHSTLHTHIEMVCSSYSFFNYIFTKTKTKRTLFSTHPWNCWLCHSWQYCDWIIQTAQPESCNPCMLLCLPEATELLLSVSSRVIKHPSCGGKLTGSSPAPAWSPTTSPVTALPTQDFTTDYDGLILELQTNLREVWSCINSRTRRMSHHKCQSWKR